MELKEKIELVENLKNEQARLNEELKNAEKNNDNSEIERINEKLQNVITNIKEVNQKFQSEMENRPEDVKIKEEATAFLTKGNEIDNKMEEYNNLLSDGNLSNEDRASVEEKLQSLNAKKNRLKGEIYNAALKKSGLDYNGGEISTSAVIKRYISGVEKLEKEKQELEAQKAKQQEIIEQKKAEMTAQFNVAVEKYKEMLDSGKISLEMYEKRIISMSQAKEQDAAMLDKSLESFDIKLKENGENLAKAEEMLKENQEKFKIYDEYDRVYYDLFGEPLDKFAKERYKIMKDSISENNIANKENTKSVPKSDLSNEEEIAKDNIDEGDKQGNNENNVKAGMNVQTVEAIENKEEKPIEVIVTSKTMFDNLYKKLSKGDITDEELNALAKVLENEDNYDKYGITTGLVFNKAKRILKAQGAKTAKSIDEFLQKAGKFAPDVAFDVTSENENVLSHDLLNSWKNISNAVVFTDKEFSIEKYISEIERYKEEGNTLTKEQESMYEEMTKIKERIVGYKKAVNTNEEVAMKRDAKMHNSVFYNMFRNKFSENVREALPEVKSPASNDNKIMADEVLDLSQMVNTSYEEQEIVVSEDSRERSRDNSMER